MGIVPLPFRLKVPGRDLSRAGTVAWTSFRMHGLLHFDGEAIGLAWSGSGSLDAVTGLEVRSETVTLPTESLRLPLTRLRSVRLLGGWWRPRLDLTANDLDALATVPSAEGGGVRMWLARRDRRLAAALVAEILATAHARQLPHSAPGKVLPAVTPPEGSPR